ncbi:MAG: hypothetical protein IJT02_00870 [Synergistaceae bacterium]|nr:hypothetical protein [Synergistaceae bacterium]
MKKFAVLLAAVLCAAVFCGVLYAEEREAVKPSPIDDTLRNGTEGKTIDGNGMIIQKMKDENREQGGNDNQKKETPAASDYWHPDAKYRVTKWEDDGTTLTLTVEDRNGEEADPIISTKGKLPNERPMTLHDQMPLQFTVPDWVEVVHLWSNPGYNYKINLKDGKLTALRKAKKGDGKAAYPRNTVLVKDGNTMTVWLLQ